MSAFSHSNSEFWNCMIIGKKMKHVSEVSHLPDEYLKGVLTCTDSREAMVNTQGIWEMAVKMLEVGNHPGWKHLYSKY